MASLVLSRTGNQTTMNHATPIPPPELANDTKPRLWPCVKSGLRSTAGPIVIALFFVSVWSLTIPVIFWTETGYQPWNAPYGDRFAFTLALLLIELPVAV